MRHNVIKLVGETSIYLDIIHTTFFSTMRCCLVHCPPGQCVYDKSDHCTKACHVSNPEQIEVPEVPEVVVFFIPGTLCEICRRPNMSFRMVDTNLVGTALMCHECGHMLLKDDIYQYPFTQSKPVNMTRTDFEFMFKGACAQNYLQALAKEFFDV